MTSNQSVSNHFGLIFVDGKRGIQSVLIAAPDKKISKKRKRDDDQP
jgi:hypothetical protein